MGNRHASRYALSSYVCSALLTGCGGMQLPIGPPGLLPQSSSVLDDTSNRSWILPEAAKQDLLYVDTVRSVTIYSYPQGNLEGKLTGFAFVTGECADTSGNVFVITMNGHVHEYRHGESKPFLVLRTPMGGAMGCGWDPTTGNLAVASFGGTLAIYKKARGKPTMYQSSSFRQFWFCGYDGNGNLYVDGFGPGGVRKRRVELGVLGKGGSEIDIVKLNQIVKWPGQVQWDGKYITVSDHYIPAVYRFAIHDSQGTKVGTTRFGHPAQYVNGSWIQGDTVVAPNTQITGKGYSQKTVTDILFYRYPKGGAPFKTISGALYDPPEAATVSLAPR